MKICLTDWNIGYCIVFIVYLDARIKLSFHRPWSSSSICGCGFLLRLPSYSQAKRLNFRTRFYKLKALIWCCVTPLFPWFLSGSRSADSCREHDPALRESQGWLVDEHCPLQQRAYQKRSYCWQDCVQEESGKTDSFVPQGRARTPTQLPQGTILDVLCGYTWLCAFVVA